VGQPEVEVPEQLVRAVRVSVEVQVALGYKIISLARTPFMQLVVVQVLVRMSLV
jgi:hypothetical protein